MENTKQIIYPTERIPFTDGGHIIQIDKLIEYNGIPTINFKVRTNKHTYCCTAKNTIAEGLSRQNIYLNKLYCMLSGFMVIKFNDETKLYTYDVAINVLKYI